MVRLGTYDLDLAHGSVDPPSALNRFLLPFQQHTSSTKAVLHLLMLGFNVDIVVDVIELG